MEIDGVTQTNHNYSSSTNTVAATETVNVNNASEAQIQGQKDVDTKALDKALKKLNKFLEDDNTHAEYSVHEDLNAIMIKIVDDNTKEVIMEIPPEKILDMVASICKQFGLIDQKA